MRPAWYAILRIGRPQRHGRPRVDGGLIEPFQAVQDPCQRIMAIDVAAHRQLGASACQGIAKAALVVGANITSWRS